MSENPTQETSGKSSLPKLSATAPRKRRRRAPATGAAEDCFTCANRKIKCDRRRPYCSQCLEIGKDCSGYKTTLTWGVGVASRGKLRGLSLPIPNKKQSGSGVLGHAHKKSTLPSHRVVVPSSSKPPRSYPSNAVYNSDSTSSEISGLQSQQPLPDLIPSSSNFPQTTSQWHNTLQNPLQNSLQTPLQNPLQNPPQNPRESISSSTSSSQQIHAAPLQHGYPTNSGQALSPDGLAASSSSSTFSDSPPVLNSSPHDAPTGLNTSFGSEEHLPLIAEDLDDEIGTNFNTSVPTQWYQPNIGYIPGTIPINNGEYDGGYDWQKETSKYFVTPSLYQPLTRIAEVDGDGDQDDIETITRNDFPGQVGFVDGTYYAVPDLSRYTPKLALGSTPRMQFLIEYFDKVISPVIVAFDGPTNPYRSHILPLAAQSETLQHAIAALSATNLRIRRDQKALSTGKTPPARRSSDAHQRLCAYTRNNVELFQAIDDSNEERYHKGASIQALNRELSDPQKVLDDSTLATLLVLCLFHICDSGVAKFKTQFAGVRKLLGLREGGSGRLSQRIKWFVTMFTFFDAMTATVNDREGQLQENHINMAALCDDEWALENLAGCDGRLFKIVAQLNKLNLLGQNKKMDNGSAIPRPMRPTHPSMEIPSFSGDFYFMNYSDFDCQDWAGPGNGATPLAVPEENRAQFWSEYNAVRTSLLQWQMDPVNPNTPCAAMVGPNRDDVSNISESFRYSALIYCERLAYPSKPSSHPDIQVWVRQALDYIQKVQSDVFLLWPLFVTGSECVTAIDRQVVRQRCLDIQKDSGFYNNISVLRLLEQIWKESPVCVGPNQSSAIQGFKWRTAMVLRPGEGEYIVI
ncbi:MAG: hypothetical protein M1834_004190 [Cirrosporium novae-zelandiae]|nr:MAG: hypothetical protein M1834_004190 [Cirrosporium novae-zelandiae]